MKLKLVIVSLLIVSLLSCKTIDLEEASKTPVVTTDSSTNEEKSNVTDNNTPHNDGNTEDTKEENKTTSTDDNEEAVEVINSDLIDIKNDDIEKSEYIVKETLKVQDMENTVVYIERPVYIPEEKEQLVEIEKVTGYEASVESEKKKCCKT